MSNTTFRLVCLAACGGSLRIGRLVLGGALLLFSICVPVLGQEACPKGISVSGQGHAFAAPDIARVSVGVLTESKDAAQATSENAAKTQKVMDTLLSAGVAKNDIQTTQYSLQALYDYKVSPPRLRGYQVSNAVRVTVRDIKKTGDMIDRSIGAGANNVQGISFEMADDTEQRNQALAKAAQEAAAKAAVLAKALNVTLGRIQSASESVSRPVYPMFARAEMAAAAPPTPVAPGEIEITANVTLVYEIRP